MNLATPIENLKYARKNYLSQLRKLGIKTIKDLLWHFPMRYDDWTEKGKVEDIRPNEKISLIGKVVGVENQRVFRRRMVLTTASIEDETGKINAIWYNQPFLVHTIKPGKLISVSGKVKLDKYGIYLQNPSYEMIKNDSQLTTNNLQHSKFKHTAGLIPVYPETEGLTSRYLRFLIKPLLKYASRVLEFLPREILERQKLFDVRTALNEIHFPSSLTLAEEARRRFAFDELFLLQLKALEEKHKLKIQKAYRVKFNKELVKSFLKTLPFELTGAQKLALWEIIKDIEKPYPMNRLLNGDVGSGKTIVALIAVLQTIREEYKAVFMAPTEVLAIQHFNTASKILKKSRIKIAILTGSKKLINENGKNIEIKKQELINKINSGDIDLIIGTHALLQEGVKPSKLAFLVIDEQHRFGVEQRAKLLKSDGVFISHLLSMSATPIPRTLALTIYGDLDISVLNEMPKGRKKIITRVIKPEARTGAYEFIRNRVKKKEQIFVICPRIEPKQIVSLQAKRSSLREREIATVASGNLTILTQQTIQLSLKEQLENEVKAVKSEYEKLSKTIFPDLKVAILHGKMKAKEKEEIMKKFKDKKYDILVSTSVIEVGVDIPDATIMMIEGAERFGLAQLHQFRGRVGRLNKQSYCLLFTESPEIETTKRLEAMKKYDSGFKLAEMDLKIRGPGEFLGKEQSGIPDLTMASLADIELIKKARVEAQLIISKGLNKYPLLLQKLKEFRGSVHLE